MRAVVGVCRQPEEVIKANRPGAGFQRLAPVGGGVTRLEAEMPLADRGCLIAPLLAERCEGEPVGLDVERCIDREHAAILDSRPPVIAAGEESVPRRRADGTGCVGLGKPAALAGQPIDVGRFESLASVAAEAAPAQVVGQDHDDVGSRFGGGLALA